MKKVKWILGILVFTVSLLLSGEVYQNYLNVFRNQFYHFEAQYTPEYAPYLSTELSRLSDTYHVPVFAACGGITAQDQFHCTVYATDSAKQALSGEYAVHDGTSTSFFSGQSIIRIRPISEMEQEHAASTSKKIKAVIEANAKAGKYRTTCAPFGYTKGDDPNHLPVIDPDAAPIVRNIFEMRASGISPHHIADKLNEDCVPIPSDYYYAKLGKPNPRRTRHMWSPETVRQILHNYTYLGYLVQLRTRTVSYKNHKVIKNDEEDMIVVKNTHEPIVSQELWDRVREME